jgi:hypothetical protein
MHNSKLFEYYSGCGKDNIPLPDEEVHYSSVGGGLIINASDFPKLK